MTMRLYTADWVYANGTLQAELGIAVQQGVITEVAPLVALKAKFPTAEVQHYPDALLLPGLVNSHNHSFQSLLKGFCDDQDFFTWRDQALYKYARIMSREDLYVGALFAFSEMLKAGITTVCDFFYIHDQANQNAETIIQAALDVGIRIVMARTMYDWEGAPVRFQETVDQAVNNTRNLHQAFQGHPLVHVIPAPHSLHGASVPMIQAGAALAEELNTKFHMHIAEGEYERQMVTEKHGKPPIAFLDELGVLNERLVGIHCVWLDDAEIQLMATRGSGLSYNPSSNMFLGDGITRICDLHRAGVTISLGTDGGCSNNRASIIEEMRMTSLLQKVTYRDSTVTQAEDMLKMGTVNGGLNLGLPIGDIQPSFAADFTVVNLNDLSMQPRQHAVKNLVYASQPSAIQHVIVAGETVMSHGVLGRMPEAQVVEKIHQVMQRWR